MPVYRNLKDSKIVNTKSNFDCNINYFSGRQVGSYLDISVIPDWKPSTMYGTYSGNVRVASSPLVRVYQPIASSFNSLPTLGAAGIGDSYFKFIADNTESSPYRDINLTIPSGVGTGVLFATTLYDVISRTPGDSLYNYNVAVCNTSTYCDMTVYLYGIEDNFGGTYRTVNLGNFDVLRNTTEDALVPGLYINGDAKIKVYNKQVTDICNLYIRIREVN